MRTSVGAEKMAVTEGWVAGDRLSLSNSGPRNACVELTFCAEGQRPLGPYRMTVPARRSRAMSLDDLAGPAAALSPGTLYAVAIVSDADVVAQLTHDLTHDAHEAHEAHGQRPAA
ncbi:sensory rhodopsin transducer [Nonomuraea sp. NPDC050783]|uniref:sensory rhodopsin transducer n=1 Tax=Nonomuraea sp. NPDC050783 TaxID=3154634 RepID=UPI003467AFBD